MKTTTLSAAASGTFKLGNDLAIHRLGFGAMRITGKGIWGEPADPEEARRVLRRSIELGVDFIDTADSYGPEVSERLIGPDQWAEVGRPEYIQQCVEMSLRRLRLERIDLYQLHRIDSKVPVEETLGVLKELQHEGKIRHIGLSEVSTKEIEHAQKIVPIVSVQNRYNLADREHEDVLNYCETHNLGFIPWFPVAAGDLAKPGGPLDQVAKKHNATVAQLSVAWLLHRSPVMLPIPGTSSVNHLEENVAAAILTLPKEEWQKIELAVAK